MTQDKHLFLMRNLYTGLQAETMLRYGKAGMLEETEQQKRAQSLAGGERSCQMLGVARPEQAFSVPSEIAECASWEIASEANGLTAVCGGCKLAGMCKQLNTPSPCNMYCLNPIEGMIKALKPDAEFRVKSTLWEDKTCTVEVSW